MKRSNKERFLAGEVFRASEDSYTVRFIKKDNTIVLVENGKDTEELCKSTSTYGTCVEYEGINNGLRTRGLLMYDNMIFSCKG